jgi:hypothetical protein
MNCVNLASEPPSSSTAYLPTVQETTACVNLASEPPSSSTQENRLYRLFGGSVNLASEPPSSSTTAAPLYRKWDTSKCQSRKRAAFLFNADYDEEPIPFVPRVNLASEPPSSSTFYTALGKIQRGGVNLASEPPSSSTLPPQYSIAGHSRQAFSRSEYLCGFCRVRKMLFLSRMSVG